MKSIPAREKILAKIRKALDNNACAMPFPQAEQNSENIFSESALPLDEEFVKNFSALQGRFIYCADRDEMFLQLEKLIDTKSWTEISVKDNYLIQLFNEANFPWLKENTTLANAQVGISLCESLVARTGSILLSSGQDYGRAFTVYVPVHIVIAFRHQLVSDIADALINLQTKYDSLPSLISLASGPSRTADIEKTLVVGIHGPMEVYVFFVDS